MTVRGEGGRGGRNTEFLLGLAIQLHGLDGVWAIAGDTDGIDGSEDNAGAIVTPDTLERALAKGRQGESRCWARTMPGASSRRWAISVVTGPTLTNVNDFRAVLIQPAAA